MPFRHTNELSVWVIKEFIIIWFIDYEVQFAVHPLKTFEWMKCTNHSSAFCAYFVNSIFSECRPTKFFQYKKKRKEKKEKTTLVTLRWPAKVTVLIKTENQGESGGKILPSTHPRPIRAFPRRTQAVGKRTAKFN